MRRACRAAPLLLLLLLASTSCRRTGAVVQPPQLPPQIKVADWVTRIEKALPVAGEAVKSLRDGGRLSPSATRDAQDVMIAVAKTCLRINAILRSADPWETQRVLIHVEIVGSGVQEASRRLPPEAAAILSASIALLNQILGAVGGVSWAP